MRSCQDIMPLIRRKLFGAISFLNQPLSRFASGVPCHAPALHHRETVMRQDIFHLCIRYSGAAGSCIRITADDLCPQLAFSSAPNVLYHNLQSSGFRVWHTFVLMFGTLLMNIKNSPVLP